MIIKICAQQLLLPLKPEVAVFHSQLPYLDSNFIIYFKYILLLMSRKYTVINFNYVTRMGNVCNLYCKKLI